MRDQLIHIDHPILHQPNRLRPRIRIPILELQIDLLRAEAHERDLHLIAPNTDDEDFPAELDGPDRGCDRGLDARAFDREARGFAGEGGLDDGLRVLFGGEGGLDLVCLCAGHEGLCEFEAVGVDVGDDQGAGAGCLTAEESHETDGPRATDEDRVSEFEARAIEAGEGDGEWFEETAVLVAHVADLVAPRRLVFDVTA